jgi:hypothetical protein
VRILTSRSFVVIFFIIVGLSLISLTPANPAFAQEDSIGVRFLSGIQEVTPRQTFTLLVEVENRSESDQLVVSELTVPAGWRLLVPSELVELEPEESTIFAYPILVAQGASPGNYGIRISCSSPRLLEPVQAEVTVRVVPITDISVEPLNVPKYVLEESYTAEFLVHNEGNTTQELLLEVRENLGLSLTVEPASVTMKPGESARVKVKVEVPRTLKRLEIHRLQLVARSETEPKVSGQTLVSVELIPTVLPVSGAYHTFPLDITLKCAREDDSNGEFGWSVTGSGTLSEQDSMRLSVDFNDERQRITLQDDGIRVSAGTQNFYLSRLTDPGTLGAGLDVWLQKDRWSSQVFTYKKNADDEASWRSGGRITFRPNKELGFSLRVLDRPELNAGIMSAQSQFLLRDHWNFDLEYGWQNDRQPGSPQAGRIEIGYVNGNIFSIGSWEETDERYGGIQDTRSRWNWLSGVRLSGSNQLTVNYLQEKRQKASGGQYQSRLSSQVNGKVRDNRWVVSYTQSVLEDPGESKDERTDTVRFYLFSPLGDGHSLQNSLAWTTNLDRINEKRYSSLKYGGNYRISYAYGSVNPFLTVDVSLDTGQEPAEIGLGLRWQHRFHDRLSLVAVGEVQNIREEKYRLYVNGQYRLLNGHLFRASAWRQMSPNTDPDYRIDLSYSIPFDLPVKKRSDIGIVKGRVVDQAGNGIPNLVVRLNGQSVQTGIDGTFQFPAVPPGVTYLTLQPDQLGPDFVTEPETPLKVEVPSGQTIEHTIQVVEAASVTGRIGLAMPDGATTIAGAVLGSSESVDPNVLRGVVVELRSDKIVHRRIIRNSDGLFSFRNLTPGTWTLVVHPNGLSDFYKFAPTNLVLTLNPGERREINIEVVPVTRKIRFIDNGEVTLRSSK